ncbi:MAG: hypothetical protein JXR46_12460 [Calditrichaceae bacterium]|nr:hypothetical protein [Calditrichaceae bacterium]
MKAIIIKYAAITVLDTILPKIYFSKNISIIKINIKLKHDCIAETAKIAVNKGISSLLWRFFHTYIL